MIDLSRIHSKDRTEYLFFLDSLLEIVQDVDFGFNLFYSTSGCEIYQSRRLYYSPEQALEYAKWQALTRAIERSHLITASCRWGSDRVLCQSEDAIELFGDACSPSPMDAKLFYPSRSDRADLLKNVWQQGQTESMMTLQNLELQITTGKVEIKIIKLAKHSYCTLEQFLPD